MHLFGENGEQSHWAKQALRMTATSQQNVLIIHQSVFSQKTAPAGSPSESFTAVFPTSVLPCRSFLTTWLLILSNEIGNKAKNR